MAPGGTPGRRRGELVPGAVSLPAWFCLPVLHPKPIPCLGPRSLHRHPLLGLPSLWTTLARAPPELTPHAGLLIWGEVPASGRAGPGEVAPGNRVPGGSGQSAGRSSSFPAHSYSREAGGIPQHPHAVLHCLPGLWPGDRARHPVQEPLRGPVPVHNLRDFIFHAVHPALLAPV